MYVQTVVQSIILEKSFIIYKYYGNSTTVSKSYSNDVNKLKTLDMLHY